MKRVIEPERIQMSKLDFITEKILQEKIAENPSILGLGDLILKDQERIQPKAGRLDLLMQDPETKRRYEIEIQLGKTNESHIMRTIEYWDIERKRYPQYDHCAVIIAEDITSRFLNVISLFNGFIPLIAIQMNTYQFEDKIGLIFTKVLDEMPLGLLDEDEEVKEVANREYWLDSATIETVEMADQILSIINSFEAESKYELKYNKFYIGLAINKQPNNFAIMRPKKKGMILELKLPKTEEIDQIIEEKELDDMGYERRFGNYRIKLTKGEIFSKEDTLRILLEKAMINYNR